MLPVVVCSSLQPEPELQTVWTFQWQKETFPIKPCEFGLGACRERPSI